MSEKLEAAKIATQLTIALIEDKTRKFDDTVRSARAAGASKDMSDTSAVFDTLFKHVYATLGEQ